MNRHPHALSRRHQSSLVAGWRELCVRYLPRKSVSSIWRYSRESLPDDPEQGWKLHVSATVLTAVRVLQVVAPLLNRRNVLYKAPASLDEVVKLNAGIFYGYSQVGKFLTVYPRTTEEALLLARTLYRLTKGMTAPTVPFDLRYRPDGCVYYRYGAFRALEVDDSAGERSYAIRDPDGHLVPDQRDDPALPSWVTDPFSARRLRRVRNSMKTPLQIRVKAFRALAQRGKGGVYQAVDLGVTPPRLCILKEGRRDGEVGWDGRDGSWRARHEGQVIAALTDAGVNVPRLYASFAAENNYYLLTEFIEGENLEEYLIRKRRKLAISTAIKRSIEVASLLAKIHHTGWVWRDCKPRNIIRTRRGELRPIDFEGACPIDQPDPQPSGTAGYVPPEWDARFRGQSRLPEDLYALGVIIFILLAGQPPDCGSQSVETLRPAVTTGIRSIVASLLDADPQNRPAASSVANKLQAELNSLLAAKVRRCKPINYRSQIRNTLPGSATRELLQ
jgi:hypothetical protein